MNHIRKKYLLEKYLKGEISKKELQELFTYKGIEESEEQIEMVLKDLWDETGNSSSLSEEKSAEIFNSLKSTIGNPVRKEGKSGVNILMKLAAVFIGIVFFAGLIYWYLNVFSYVTVETASRETKSIELPDGSKITLNSNSNIKYKKRWKPEEERVLYLMGEGFFSVTHQHNDQKFIVRTKDLEVEVLGTEFNVSASSRSSKVVLQTGKVKLSIEGKDNLIMNPGEMVEYVSKNSLVKRRDVTPETYTSWRNNVLVFNRTPLLEIAEVLKERHGLNLIIEDKSLQNEEFTGSFPMNEDLNIFLSMLSKTYNISIVKKGDTIIFNPAK